MRAQGDIMCTTALAVSALYFTVEKKALVYCVGAALWLSIT